MKFASEDLKNEHEGILFGLQILQEMVHRLHGQQPANVADYKEMLNFLKLFADKCHHGKEEGFYFPALEKAGVLNEGGPIGQMLLEHTFGRGFISRMTEATSHPFHPAGFSEAAEGYIHLLRSHIDKENNILFRMGDQLIPAPEQARLLEAFAAHELNVMGAGTHEKLHQLLNQFEENI